MNSLLVNSPGAAGSGVYSKSEQGCLRQGEILSDLVQACVKIDTIGLETYKFYDVRHPYVIVVTQDCDLEQDYKGRFEDKSKIHRLLPNILFCEVETAHELRYADRNPSLDEVKQARSKTINSTKWPPIKQNKDERFHFLQKVESHQDTLQEGLPELAVEFKRYFSLPTDEVYYRIEKTDVKRRCRLQSPYLEHFAVRFHYYHYRIALPEDHASD